MERLPDAQVNVDFRRQSATIRFNASETGIEGAISLLDGTGRYSGRVREARTTFRNAHLTILAQGVATGRDRGQITLRVSPARGVQLADVHGTLATDAANMHISEADAAIQVNQIRRDEEVQKAFTYEGELVAATAVATIEYSAVEGRESTAGRCAFRVPVYTPVR